MWHSSAWVWYVWMLALALAWMELVFGGGTGWVVGPLLDWPWYEFPALTLAPVISHALARRGRDPWAVRTLVIVTVISIVVATMLSLEWGDDFAFVGWAVAFFVLHLSVGQGAPQRECHAVVGFMHLLTGVFIASFALIAAGLVAIAMRGIDADLPHREVTILGMGVLYYLGQALSAPRLLERFGKSPA